MSLLLFVGGGAFLLGLVVSGFVYLGYRSWLEGNHIEAYLVSPSSKSIRRKWVPKTQGRAVEMELEESEDGGLVALDGSFAMQGDTGQAWLVDSDEWKVLDVQEERFDVPQLYPLDGRQLREIVYDERVKEWQMHNSGQLNRMLDLLPKAMAAGGVLLVGIIILLVNGFGMI